MYDCFGRNISYLRVSLTDRCNLRCRYCMPEEGVPMLSHEDILSFEEIEQVVATAVRMGVHKVRLTGGEPLVRKGVVTMVAMLGRIPGIEDFAMTTNGTLLAPVAEALKHAGLGRLNISLDALDPDAYREITRGGDVTDVLAGIAAAQRAGFEGTKLNCVVEESSDEANARDVVEFARRNGLEVRFIRRMDLAEGQFWKVEGGDGGNCSACNRLRLTSDGRIVPCLFSRLAYSVRELGVEEALRQAIMHKPERGATAENWMRRVGG
jgi:cyclic pyranopterin phosphate synthase